MKQKGIAVGAIFVVALFIGMMLVPAVGAYKRGNEKRYGIDEQRLEVIRQLWGKTSHWAGSWSRN